MWCCGGAGSCVEHGMQERGGDVIIRLCEYNGWEFCLVAVDATRVSTASSIDVLPAFDLRQHVTFLKEAALI